MASDNEQTNHQVGTEGHSAGSECPVKDDGSAHAAALIAAWWQGRAEMADQLLGDLTEDHPLAPWVIRQFERARQQGSAWHLIALQRANTDPNSTFI